VFKNKGDKLIEKIISKRLTNFLNRHKLIFKHQYVFRAKHSTKNALISLTESIWKALDSGHFACSVFIDLQKAYNNAESSLITAQQPNLRANPPLHALEQSVVLNWPLVFL